MNCIIKLSLQLLMKRQIFTYLKMIVKANFWQFVRKCVLKLCPALCAAKPSLVIYHLSFQLAPDLHAKTYKSLPTPQRTARDQSSWACIVYMSDPMMSSHIFCWFESNDRRKGNGQRQTLIWHTDRPQRGQRKSALTKCQVSGRKCQQVTSQAANGQPAKARHMSPRDLCTGAASSEQQAASTRHQQMPPGTLRGAETFEMATIITSTFSPSDKHETTASNCCQILII